MSEWLPHPNFCGFCGQNMHILNTIIVHGYGSRTETERRALLTTDCSVCVAKAGQICVNIVTGEKLSQRTPCHPSRVQSYLDNPIPITSANHCLMAHEESPGKDHPLRNWNADCFSSQRDGSLFCSLIRNRPNEWQQLIPVGGGGYRPEPRKPILWAMCS